MWSEEAFQLWTQAWAPLYDDESESSALLYQVSEWVTDEVARWVDVCMSIYI